MKQNLIFTLVFFNVISSSLSILNAQIFNNGKYQMTVIDNNSVEIIVEPKTKGVSGIQDAVKVCWKKSNKVGLICYINQKIFMWQDYEILSNGGFKFRIKGLT
ncbi:MAG: hypothetical protein AAF573_18340, partial [Bacteroidota bacterium]